MKSTIPPRLPSPTFYFLSFVILYVLVFFPVTPLLLLTLFLLILLPLLLTLLLRVILTLLPLASISLGLFALLLHIRLYHPGQPMCHGKAPHMVPLAAATTNVVGLAPAAMGAHPAAWNPQRHVDGLGHYCFPKAAPDKVPLPVKRGTCSPPPPRGTGKSRMRSPRRTGGQTHAPHATTSSDIPSGAFGGPSG